MAKLRVEGHENLVRDTTSNAVINSSSSEYRIYMSRHRARNKQSDELRNACLLYTSPSPRDRQKSRMPSSA